MKERGHSGMGFPPRKLGEKPIHSCPIISLSEQVQLNKETISYWSLALCHNEADTDMA